MIRSKYITITALAGITLASCSKDANSPGYEYMPDMYRSGAVEAYVDYHHPDSISAMVPPDGTIPYSEDPSKAVYNMPYTLRALEDYEKSAAIKSPLKYTEQRLKEGEALYTKFCMHCHGKAGDGQGQIALNGKIEGIPSYSGTLKNLPEGKMFHTITYGKGLMGPHAGLLNKEERWKVILWVKALQNGGKYPEAAETATADSAAVTPAAAGHH